MRTGEPYWGARTRAKKIFEKKLDNFKNLCYNKYVRLRGKQTSLSCGYGGTQTHRTQNAAEKSVPVRVRLSARGKVEPGRALPRGF